MRRLMTTALLFGACTTAVAEVIELEGGDVINAEVVSRSDAGVTINHPALGEQVIPNERVVAIYADEDARAAAQAEAAALEAAAERAADEGLFGLGLFEGWNRRLETGISGAEGNSQNFNFRIGFHADYEDDEDRWLFDTVYRVARSNGSTTQNQFFAELIKDWLVPEEDYFYFANGRFDWDEFQDWDHRWSGFLGMGYQFLDDDTWNVRGRAGVGGNQENGGTLGDEFTVEALVGGEVDYVISDDHRITFTNYLYPSLEDIQDFRNVTTFGYVIALDTDMDLLIGMSNEYDSSAAGGAKKNDFTYFVSLVWAF